VDTDGGIKAAIWGGFLAARHACVVGMFMHPGIYAALLLIFMVLK
jgi:hypothetical protein